MGLLRLPRSSCSGAAEIDWADCASAEPATQYGKAPFYSRACKLKDLKFVLMFLMQLQTFVGTLPVRSRDGTDKQPDSARAKILLPLTKARH